jgi:hypothetical protein
MLKREPSPALLATVISPPIIRQDSREGAGRVPLRRAA